MTIAQEIINWTIKNAFNVEDQDGTKYIVIDHEEMRLHFDKWLEKEKKQIQKLKTKNKYEKNIIYPSNRRNVIQLPKQPRDN